MASRLISRIETDGASAVALVAALAAAWAPGAPTGIVVWDAILKFVLVGMATLGASRAPRSLLVVVATVAAAAGGLSVWGIVGWLALLAAMVQVLSNRHAPIAGAIIGALAFQTLLRLPAFGFFGLPSIVAGVAAAVMLATGYVNGSQRTKRVVRWSVAGFAVVGVGLAVTGMIAVRDARADAERGTAAARNAVEAARAGDTERVAEELAAAEQAFASAEASLQGLGPSMLRLVPIAAQHHHAMVSASSHGATIAGTAREAAQGTDVTALWLDGGVVDVPTLQSLAPQLRETADAIETARLELDELGSPWLLPALSERLDDASADIDGLASPVETVATAAELLPGALGIESPQTYFVMFGNPAESRELGGFLGSWALLTFDGGRLQLGDSGRIDELYDIALASTLDPATVSPWFQEMARPTQFPQNLTSSPDFAQVGTATRQVLAGATEQELAGFIYLDTWAVIALLEITGPVNIPFQEAPLTAANAPRFFFVDQYLVEEANRSQIFDSLAQVAGTALEQIGDQPLPGPGRLSAVLGPVVAGGHMQMVSIDADQNDLLRSVGLLRDFGMTDTTDFVGVVQTNGLPNKMDLYLERDLAYEAHVLEDGAIEARAIVGLTSTVPNDAPEFTLGPKADAGVNQVLLSLYSPHNLQAVSINGVPAELRSTREFGLNRYLVEVMVPPTAERVVVEFVLAGALAGTDEYSVEVWKQPLIKADDVTISSSWPGGSLSWTGKLVENLTLRAEAHADVGES